MKTKFWNIRGCAILVATVLAPAAASWAADPSRPATVAIPKVSPVLLEVRMTSGNFVPMGGKANIEVKKPSGAQGDNMEVQTLAISVTNRSPKPLQDVTIRYSLYKVTVTPQSTTYGGTKTPAKESPPTSIADGSKSWDLKMGEKQALMVQGYLTIFDNTANTNTGAYAGNTSTGGYTATRQEEMLYGYIVEVSVGGEKVTEKLYPSDIRKNIQAKGQ
jgi:hypothetical protein